MGCWCGYEHYKAKKENDRAQAGAHGDPTEFVSLWADKEDIERPKTPETYAKFEGIRAARQILAGPTEDVVSWRKYACWCPACMGALTRTGHDGFEL